MAIAGDVAIAAAKVFVAALTGSSAMHTEGVQRSQGAVDAWHAFGDGKTTSV